MADVPLAPEEPKLPAPSGGADPGILLLAGLVVGYGYYWFATREQNAEPADEEDEYDDDEIERPKRVGRYADVTTDTLIDRPAVLADSGDCYKAVLALPGSQALARTSAEKKIFKRVLKAVADDCHHAEEDVDRAMEALERQRDEIEDMLDVDTTEVDSDPDRIIQARRNAQDAVRRGTLTRTRKKRIPREEEIEWLDRVSSSRGQTSRGGRRGGASVFVTKKSGDKFRLKKEKAPTKRGFKWRKESM